LGYLIGCGSNSHSTARSAPEAIYYQVGEEFGATLSAIVGAGIGCLGGTVVGLAASTPDKEFAISTPRDLLALKFFARFPASEPDSLKHITAH
jgi:hypothetical protein